MSKVIDQPTGTGDQPAAAVVPNFEERVTALNPMDRAKWELTGELPVATNSDAVDLSAELPAPSPGASDDSEESESGAAPDPAIDEQPRVGESPEQKSERKKRNDHTRYVREKTRADMLERQLAEMKAASAPAPKPAEPAKVIPAERPKRPKISDFSDGNLYDAAMDKYETDLDSWNKREVDQRLSGVRAEQQQSISTLKLNERFDAARKKYADYDAVAFSDKIPASYGMIDVLQQMENGADIQYKIGKNITEAARIAELTYVPGEEHFKTPAEFKTWVKSDPDRAMLYGRKLAMAESELSKLSQAAQTRPPARPKPTSEVAVEPRGAAVTDELADATKRGDFEAYERLANQRDIQERTGRG